MTKEFEVKLKLAISEKLSNLPSFERRLNYLAWRGSNQLILIPKLLVDSWSEIIVRELTKLGGNPKEFKTAIINMPYKELIGLSELIGIVDIDDFKDLIEFLFDLD